MTQTTLSAVEGTGPPVGLRRRSTPHVLGGAVLVVVCALTFAVIGLRTNPRAEVLVLARPVPAGHVLTDTDLTVVGIVPDPLLGVVPAAQRATVLGRRVRLPVAAHALLSRDLLGPAGWPPAGESVIAVAVKTGHAPTGVTPGAQVLVLVVPSASTPAATTDAGTSDGGVQRAAAVVVAVGAADVAGTVVVSLLLADVDAVRVAGAGGDVSLLVRGGAG